MVITQEKNNSYLDGGIKTGLDIILRAVKTIYYNLNVRKATCQMDCKVKGHTAFYPQGWHDTQRELMDKEGFQSYE